MNNASKRNEGYPTTTKHAKNEVDKKILVQLEAALGVSSSTIKIGYKEDNKKKAVA